MCCVPLYQVRMVHLLYVLWVVRVLIVVRQVLVLQVQAVPRRRVVALYVLHRPRVFQVVVQLILVQRIDGAIKLKDADDEIKGLLEEKQNALIPTDDYITIENDEIFVNVDNLKEALAGATGEDGREIELDKVGDYLVWRYVGDSSWNNLIAIADITGPQGPQGEKGEPGDPANLTDYPTKTDMEDAISAAVDNLAATYATKEELADYVKTETANATYATKDELSGKLDSDALAGYATTVGVQTAIREATDGLATSAELTTGLAGKANVADVYTKSEVYNKTEVNDLVADVAAGDMQEALKDYAKTSDVEAGLAEKADKTALDSKADATVVDALSSKVDTIGVAADNAGLAATAAAETAGAAKTTADHSLPYPAY